MVSEDLKKLAALLREKAADFETHKNEKCAQVLLAAAALERLREKVSENVR